MDAQDGGQNAQDSRQDEGPGASSEILPSPVPIPFQVFKSITWHTLLEDGIFIDYDMIAEHIPSSG